MENWDKLPESVKQFKTPYSDMIVMRSTSTEGRYVIRHFTPGEGLKATLTTSGGKLQSKTYFAIYDAPIYYDESTDEWTYGKKTTTYSLNLEGNNLQLSGSTMDDVLYCTIDLYDSTYAEILRPKDPKVNCFGNNHYELMQELLEVEEIKEVLDLKKDAILTTQSATTVTVYVAKDHGDTPLEFKGGTSSYVYFQVGKSSLVYTIKLNSTTMTVSSSSNKTATSTFDSMYKTSYSLGNYLSFTNVPIISTDVTPNVTIIPAQKLPGFLQTLPNELNVTPASIEDLVGTTHQLEVEVLPEDADDKSVSFTSDNPNSVYVDNDGLITLKKEGTATITVQSNSVPELSKQVTVISNRPFDQPVITSLTVDPSTPNENEAVEFAYEATYDRSSFKAEEWENKQSTYEAGQHTVRVRVQDSNDLWSDWKELTFNVNAVYQAPTISNLTMTPAQPQIGEKVSFSYDKALDPRLSVQSENWVGKQDSYEAGTHTVKLTITDSANQVSNELSVTFSIEQPLETPVISNLRMTPEAPGYGEAVEFTYDCVLDPRLTLQKENWTNKQSSYLDGNHTVKLSITDSEGQTSNELTLSFSIERPYDQPSISNLRMTPSNPQPGETVSFSYDKNLDSRLQVKQENWVNKQSSYEAGTHTVKLTVTDTADQTSNELSLTFSIEQPLEAPVISNLRIDPATPNAGEEVSFIYDKVIDERLTLKTENWVGKQDTYEAGQHTVKLTITDSADQVSNELSLTFDVAYVPEVPVLESISMTPPHPVEGEMVTFSYIALIDDQATMQEEIWENKRETYPAGDHEVALTIVDSFNQHSNRLTFNFHVESLPEPSPDPGPTPEPEPNPGPDTDPDNPEMPDEFPVIYDIVVDPPQPRAGELLSYSYTVALEAGTSVQKIEWENKQLIYEESGVVDVALKIIDSKGQEAIKTVEIDVLEASDTPQPPKPTRIKHLEVTRWDSASKRFLILEAREK